MRSLTLLVAKLRRLGSRREGNVMMLFGLGAVMLFCAAGIGIDMGRAYSARLRLNAALDAAALAVGALPNSATAAQQNAELQSVFNANYPANKIGGGNIAPAMSISGGQITVTATTTVNTLFMQIMPGVSGAMTVSATSVIQKTSAPFELAIVLDNTGSMLCGDNWPTNCNETGSDNGQDHQQALVSATQNMVNTLINGGGDLAMLKVAFVPYVTTVNAGPALNSASQTGGLTTTFASTMAESSGKFIGAPSPIGNGGAVINDINNNPISFNTAQTENTGEWRGCIVEPNATNYSTTVNAYTTSEPAGGWTTKWYAFYWEPTPTPESTTNPNNWNATDVTYGHGAFDLMTYWDQGTDGGGGANSTNQGPNNGCPTPMLRLMPMNVTANQTALQNAASGMEAWAAGGTMIHEGMIWGWRALSPNPPFSDGAAYPSQGGSTVKVVVLETDGLEESIPGQQTAFGNPTTSSTTWLDNDLTAVCTNMKNLGMVIYTIGFAVGANNTQLQDCAGGTNGQLTGQFYAATQASQLDSIFQNIAGQINQLRVAR